MPKQQIFISYAYRDGRELAMRLNRELTSREFDVWMDEERLQGGDRWSREIQAALERADAVLVLLSSGSFNSDECRAEQIWAIRSGKRVIPILLERGCEVEYHFSTLHSLDFSDAAIFERSFQQLVQSLGELNEQRPRGKQEPTYNNAPPLPNNFVERTELLRRLREFLFMEGPQRNIGLTALQGMGGIGKTVLAQALCNDVAVKCGYPDGIYWFTIGKESKLSFERRMECVPGLNRLLKAYTGEAACISEYRDAMRDKAALIVLDDVWSAADIEPFRIESPRSRLLITTRDTGIASSVGARPFTADALSDDEARSVLARWAGLETMALPSQAVEIMHECENLPLALAMIGAQINGKPPQYWNILLSYLRGADLERIKAQFPEPHTTLFRAIEVSFEALQAQDEVAAARYLSLAVLLKDMTAVPVIQQTLWNVNEAEAFETSERFVELSLATREGASGGIRLHDLLLDYIRRKHLAPEALQLIHGAVRLSSHVIADEPGQFASQLIGRLLVHETVPAIRRFISEITQGAPTPWLRPCHPALHPPGTELVRTLEGHSRSVNCVALTPNGKRAVSACHDQTLKVWDLETGRPLHTLEGHSGAVTGVAVMGDGKRAVSASRDNTLKVWDLETSCALHTLKGHSDELNAVAVTADGKRAVSASDDTTIKVWDPETGLALRTMEGHSLYVTGVAVTADGKRAVSASADKTLKVWDLETGSALRTLEGHTDGVTGVAVTADGKRAVSASRDRTLKVWDLETGLALRTMEGHSGSVTGVAVTADGMRAVSVSGDKTLKVWDLETGRALRTPEGHSNVVWSVAVTADGKRAVSGSNDNTLKVWDLETGRALPKPECHSEVVSCVAVTADGKRAVSASADRTLKVWDLESGRALRLLEGHSASVRGVAVTPDGKHAVSASADRTLRVWDLETGRALRTLEDHSAPVSGVAVTADGGLAVSASDDQTLKVWDLETGRVLRTLRDHLAPVSGVAVTVEGRAVSASHDKTLKVWDLETGCVLRTLKDHSASVSSVAVTVEGKRAVSVSRDKTLKVWDLETGHGVRTLEGHSDPVYGVAVTADGNRAVSASDDKTLQVWDLESGLALASFTSDAPLYCCTFVNAHKILAGDAGGRLHFLLLDEGTPGDARAARL